MFIVSETSIKLTEISAGNIEGQTFFLIINLG
jgi:hypothetical protein